MWTYKKFDYYQVTDDLSAEIEWIKITGVKLFNNKCQKCLRGTSNKAKNRCEECGINEYFEDGRCLKCPFDKYSYPGSIGESSCIKKQPCGPKDMVATLSDCKDGFR